MSTLLGLNVSGIGQFKDVHVVMNLPGSAVSFLPVLLLNVIDSNNQKLISVLEGWSFYIHVYLFRYCHPLGFIQIFVTILGKGARRVINDFFDNNPIFRPTIITL